MNTAIQMGLHGALETLPERGPYHSSSLWFQEILRTLIHAGTIVVLDEFHHADDLGIVSGVKLVIDGFEAVNAPQVTGKLVMTGSHQQHLLRMFRSDQPLYGRFSGSLRLDPWPVSTVLEMAAEQGYLRYPKRFLTLWTAYGGIPKHWKRLAADDNYVQLRQFDAWPDDTAWRRAFLERERQVLADRSERFNSRAFVELAAVHREALLWLAQNHPKAATDKQIAAGIGMKGDPRVSDALDLLQDHLQLVELTEQFFVGGTEQWRISDNSTLFQISVFPQLFSTPKR